MAMRATAKLGSQLLPTHFRYAPYVPRKRISTIATADAVVIQSANPVIIHGEDIIEWSCASCTPEEFETFYNLYEESALTARVFLGYWGESLDVYFTVLDKPRVAGRLFSLSGQFQVIDVNDSDLYSDIGCNPP